MLNDPEKRPLRACSGSLPVLAAARRAAPLTFWLTLVSASALSAAPLAVAAAAGPDAALRYRSPRLMQAEAERARAAAELGRSYLGLSGSAEVSPYLEYREDVLNPANAPTFGPGVEAFAWVDYMHDEADILLEQIELVQAEERLRDAEREGVRAALNAHAELATAQYELALAQAGFGADTRDLADAEASFAAGEITRTELDMARLGVDSGRRSLAYARRARQNAAAAAARYGLGAAARLRPLSFALPRVLPRETLAYRRADLELRRAEALAWQNTAYGVLEEVRLGTSYLGDDYELSGGLGLDRGRPTVGASARYRGRDADAWTVRLEATLRLSDGTAEAFDVAAREVEDNRTYVAGLATDLAAELRDLRAEAVFAERSVALSVRDLSLLERRVVELEVQTRAFPGRLAEREASLNERRERLDTLRERQAAETDAERQAQLGSDLQAEEALVLELEAEVQEGVQEDSFAQSELGQLREFRDQAEGNLYREWTYYLSAVDAYLALADVRWAVAP